MSKSTAYVYRARLNDFRGFITKDFGNNLSIDDLLSKIKNGNENPYDTLNGYAAYLTNRNVSALTLKQHIVTVKNFFEYCDIDIIPRRFKLKVKLPKVIRKKRSAIKRRYY
jgi:site-specific recombinase XerD